MPPSREPSGAVLVGLISDTHGHLYAPVRRLLEGVDHIIHAGDIGSPEVLAGLRAIAPVTAVRGNCDYDGWAAALPVETEVELGGVRILVGHIAGRLRERIATELRRDADGARQDASPGAGLRVVVSGHSHRADSEERDGVLYLNPGSAGPERFGHPRTLALLTIMPPEQERPGLSAPPAQDRGPARVSVEFLVVPQA